MTTSGAALIAAVAWMVSVVSGKNGASNTTAAADSIRGQIRAASLHRERDRRRTRPRGSLIQRHCRFFRSARDDGRDGRSETGHAQHDQGSAGRTSSAVAQGADTDTLDIKPGERLTWAPQLEPRLETPQATPQATPDPVVVSSEPRRAAWMVVEDWRLRERHAKAGSGSECRG
jgi:hypothetical protein